MPGHRGDHRPAGHSIHQGLNVRLRSIRRNLKPRQASRRRDRSRIQSSQHARRRRSELHIPMLQHRRSAQFNLLDKRNSRRSVDPGPSRHLQLSAGH